MNKLNTIIKVISALVAVVGAVYIVATYGDKIVAWAKQLMGCGSKPLATFHYDDASEAKAEAAAPAEEPAPAEAPREEPAAAPEAPAEAGSTPVANEEDFEG